MSAWELPVTSKAGSGSSEDFQRRLGVQPGETTADGVYTLNEVRCIGACSFAPAVVVDDQAYAHVTAKKVPEILKKYRDEEHKPAPKPVKEKSGAAARAASSVTIPAIVNLRERSILVRVCMGLGGVAAGATEVLKTFRQVITARRTAGQL